MSPSRTDHAICSCPERRLAGVRGRPASIQAVSPSVEARLGRAAKGFRAAHAFIAVIDLMGLGYVWTCALTRRRDSLLRFSAADLVVEGAALVIVRGNCPLGPLPRRLGDPVPLFELVLPPRVARTAVPILAVTSVVGLALLAVRRPPDTDTS